MCRVKGPVHDALLECGLVDLVGVQHFYDSVRAAKKGRAPDGLPVVPEAGTTAAGPGLVTGSSRPPRAERASRTSTGKQPLSAGPAAWG